MAGVDKINGLSFESDSDTILNNGVGVGSIDPDSHNQLLQDAFKTAFFAAGVKYKIKQSGVPAAGEISLGGDDFDTATTIMISKTDDHANDVTLMIELIVKDYILHLKDYSGKFGAFTVVSIVDSGSYKTYTVTASGSNPSYSPTGLEGMLQAYANISSSPKIDNEYNLGDTGTAIDVDLSQGNDFLMRATDNFTLNFINAPSTPKCTKKGYIRILQDATGSRTLTLGANVYSRGGVTPSLTGGVPGANDFLEYQYNDSIGGLLILDWHNKIS